MRAALAAIGRTALEMPNVQPAMSSTMRPWAYYLKRRKWGTEITLVYENGRRETLADSLRPPNFAEAREAVAKLAAALGVELAEIE